jgi:crotonobetainyl-CoA:carnitine CoA-transferase CaiB-like acyl-CoA transferase
LLSLTYQWETLVEWLASENAAENLTGEQWLDESERQKHLDHIMTVLGKWTQKHEVDELVESGQQMHFPWARVNSIPEVINNPQLNARGYFVETKDPESGKLYKFPGAPVKMSSSPWGVQPENPLPGGYNHKIFREELGLDEAELAELKRQGVV